jgi:hypothetical protein
MSQSGVIWGIPTGSGLTRFWLWNHDLTAAQGGPSWCARDDVSQREFSIPIDPGLAIVNTAAKPGTVGQPYSETLTARRLVGVSPATTGSDVSAAWSVQSGALPPGVALSGDGLLAGTPTAEGSYQFVVKADLQNGSPPATQAYTLAVRTRAGLSAVIRAAIARYSRRCASARSGASFERSHDGDAHEQARLLTGDGHLLGPASWESVPVHLVGVVAARHEYS